MFVHSEHFIGRVPEERREKCPNVWRSRGFLDVLCKFSKKLSFNFYTAYLRFPSQNKKLFKLSLTPSHLCRCLLCIMLNIFLLKPMFWRTSQTVSKQFIFLQLTDVEKGGATVFPEAKVRVPVTKVGWTYSHKSFSFVY